MPKIKITSDRLILFAAIFWFALTAWYSIGYYHGDEHYQIIEFAGVKDGTNTAADLAWEYNAHIRPSLQPVLCLEIFKICSFFSIHDPYTKAFLLRLLTGLLAVFCIYYFAKSAKKLLAEKYWTPFLFFSFFTWFIPQLSVRFSSEAWSGMMILLSVALVFHEKRQKQHFVLLGFLLGLSFLFRFQAAIAIAGLWFWFILVKKEGYKNMAILTMAILTVILLGTLLDSWFYERFVFTPWEYLKVNILEGKAASFGSSPWYYLIYVVFRYSFFPFGSLILLSFLYLVYKKPGNILVWVILPFVAVHSSLAHKELRFLFPMLGFIPLIVFMAVQEFPGKFSGLWTRRIVNSLLLLMMIFNLTGLAVASLRPVDVGRMRISKAIHQLDPRKQYHLVCRKGCNPFDPWDGLPTKFYAEPNLSWNNLSAADTNLAVYFEKGKTNLFLVQRQDLSRPEVQRIINQKKLRKVDQSIPEIFVPVLKLYGGFPVGYMIVLYAE